MSISKVRGLKPGIIFSLKDTFIQAALLPGSKRSRSSNQSPTGSDGITFNETLSLEWDTNRNVGNTMLSKHGNGVTPVSPFWAVAFRTLPVCDNVVEAE